ncbi:MAG: HlyD family efflux transporter periplasmic adaptor subunit [Planctomycetes bacterium]|nr:HlyD family efflux transporter periplasmic adaptor subunit [Planctomycetota bacterium]
MTQTTTNTVQQVRDRVLRMAREIEELSRSNVPPDAFFQRFLQLLVAALGSKAAGVWLTGHGGRLARFCDVNLSEVGLDDSPAAQAANSRLLTEVVGDGQTRAHNADDDRGVDLPSQHHIVLAALQNGTESVGVVEVFLRPDCPREARPGYMQFVEQMCGFASKYMERPRDLPTTPATDGFLDDFARFVLELQRSLHMKEVAGTAANDGRLLLKADRLSVAVKRGRKTTVQAISGQDNVNQRANLVRAMSRLCEAVVATQDPVLYTGKVEDLPPQIEEPLAAYVQESGSRMVAVVPLFESEPLVESRDAEEDGRPRAQKRTRPVGCLLAERINDSQPPPAFQERCDLISDHIAAAITNARQHQRVFLLPVWRAIGRTTEWFHGRKLLKTLAILSLVAAIVASLVLIPWEYRVEGTGRLMPVAQSEVFAHEDGEVVTIFVEGGQQVRAGQKLVQLKNDDLAEQLSSAESDLLEKRALERAMQVEYEEAQKSFDRPEQHRVNVRIHETKTQIRGLESRIERFRERLGRLLITAPRDGVVATFQLDQKLRGRPIRRGEILMEVMDPTSDWRLELEVEEHRLGHLLRARQEQKRDDLKIEYVLATNPVETWEARLGEVATRPVPSSEGTSVVEVRGTIDPDDLPPARRIGSDVRAKIHCGKSSLGYVLFGDVIEFFQRRLWL